MSFPAQTNPGAFVPTTDNYDVQTIYNLNVNSREFKEFLVRLRQSINNIAMVLNIKDSGYYPLQEFVNGQVFFPDPTLSSSTPTAPVFRQVFRKIINFGGLPNTGTTSVAHGLTITSGFTFTRIYACASDITGSDYIPIPYASPTDASNIELRVDATDVIITTGSDRTAFTVCYVVLEFIKQ